MTASDELVELLGKDPLATGLRELTGTVTDASVWPPLIDTGGGAVATPTLRGYRPVTNDFVHVLTDWNGKYSASRICIGRIAVCGGLQVERNTNQSATGGGSVTVTWNNEVLDQGWSWVASSTDVVIPTGAGGIYAITTQAIGAGNWAIGSTLTINAPNGTNPYSFDRGRAGSRLSASVCVPLVGGDVIQIAVFNNGATQNFTAHLTVVPVA